KVTFKSTVVALDDLTYEASNAVNKATIIKETNTNAAMRTAAENAVKAFQDWVVGIDYREDVYKAIKAFADTHPKLSGEDEKLLNETLRDYRRAGLDLPPDQRKEVEQLRKELSKLGTDFDTNIVKANAPVIFTKADLDGLPESFFASPGVRTGDDAYTILANVTWQFNTVEENAKSEATRKQLYVIRETLAKEANVPVLNQMLALRNKIALRLGYKSWDDYQTEVKMAKKGANAEKYISDLVTGIQPKFESEIAELQKLKAAETNDPNAEIEVWDWRYYANQRDKQKYAVDKEALRAYFPFQKVLDGMFNIYQSIFGLKFEKIAAPYKWIDDLQLYMVTDSSTGEPLGMFYLDMFPREGKFNHFAQFEIISGKLLPDGKYQRPTVALLCNFSPPAADKPSLITHQEVETLFHEFGHALHSIVTRAKYGRFAGTHVPGDFVEAPSQMLQNWVWDKKVLDTFAADYRDPSKKIPAETIKKMNDAKLANAGAFYRRQFAFASLDLALHNQHPENDTYDCVAISNPILEKVRHRTAREKESARRAVTGREMMSGIARASRAVCCALAVNVVVFLTSCHRAETDVEIGTRLQILHKGNGQEVQDLDPQIVNSVSSLNIISALLEGLVAEDPHDLHPVPGVAESWEVSADEKVYTFHLRHNAKWSNGEPVVAQNFV